MYSVNKVTLLGNLGKDPEIRHISEGVAVANFSIATTESYKDKNTGEKREQTEWHNIVMWRGLAEIAEKYLKKGHKVYLEGKLRTRQYEDKEGQTRYITEVLADNMVMLTPREGSGQNDGSYDNNKSAYSDQQQQATNTDKARSATAAEETFAPDDDLPF